jgi:hypothetical protein
VRDKPSHFRVLIMTSKLNLWRDQNLIDLIFMSSAMYIKVSCFIKSIFKWWIYIFACLNYSKLSSLWKFKWNLMWKSNFVSFKLWNDDNNAMDEIYTMSQLTAKIAWISLQTRNIWEWDRWLSTLGLDGRKSGDDKHEKY